VKLDQWLLQQHQDEATNQTEGITDIGEPPQQGCVRLSGDQLEHDGECATSEKVVHVNSIVDDHPQAATLFVQATDPVVQASSDGDGTDGSQSSVNSYDRDRQAIISCNDAELVRLGLKRGLKNMGMVRAPVKRKPHSESC